MFEVTVLYRDGTSEVHSFAKEAKATEFRRLAAAMPTVVKAVSKEVE